LKNLDSINLNSCLASSLASSNSVFIQLALEEISFAGTEERYKNELLALSNRLSLGALKTQVDRLLKTAEILPQIKKDLRRKTPLPKDINLLIQKGKYLEISLIADHIRKPQTQYEFEAWRFALDEPRISPALVLVGMSLLSKFGKEEHLNLALKFLNDSNPQVTIAACKLLAKYELPKLKAIAPELLKSKSLDLRLAILELIYKDYPQQLLAHLAPYLSNENPLVRQKTLRKLITIDFLYLKELLWQYISVESMPLLLIKAGLLLTMNPDISNPTKLFSIIETSQPEKRRILLSFLRDILMSLKAAGLIKEDEETYLNTIKREYANQKIRQRLDLARSNFSSSDINVRKDALSIFAMHIELPAVANFLQTCLKKETNQEIAQLLRDILSSVSQDKESEEKTEPLKQPISKAAFETQPVQPQERSDFCMPSLVQFAQMNSKDQNKAIKKINSIETYFNNKEVLIAILQSDTADSVKRNILQKISDYGRQEDVLLFENLLSDPNAKEPLKAQLILTIGKIDIDRLLPHLNLYLNDRDPSIRAAAFQIYLVADKEAALQYLSRQMADSELRVRAMALNLLPLADYTATEPLVWYAMDREVNDDLKHQLAYLMASNPTEDGILKLFAFTHDKFGEIIPERKTLWEAGLFASSHVFGKTPEELTKACFAASTNEQLVEDLNRRTSLLYDAISDRDKSQSVSYEQYTLEEHIQAETPLEELLYNTYKWRYQIAIFSLFLLSVGVLYYIIKPDTKTLDKSDSLGTQAAKRAEKKYLADKEKKYKKSKSKSTQFKASDYSGSIVVNDRYIEILKEAQLQQDKIDEQLEQDMLTIYKQDSENPNLTQSEREYAAAYLIEPFREAEKAYGQDRINDAYESYKRALRDHTLPPAGKMVANARIAELASLLGRPEEAFENYMAYINGLTDGKYATMADPMLKKIKELHTRYLSGEVSYEELVNGFMNSKENPLNRADAEKAADIMLKMGSQGGSTFMEMAFPPASSF